MCNSDGFNYYLLIKKDISQLTLEHIFKQITLSTQLVFNGIFFIRPFFSSAIENFIQMYTFNNV